MSTEPMCTVEDFARMDELYAEYERLNEHAHTLSHTDHALYTDYLRALNDATAAYERWSRCALEQHAGKIASHLHQELGVAQACAFDVARSLVMIFGVHPYASAFTMQEHCAAAKRIVSRCVNEGQDGTLTPITDLVASYEQRATQADATYERLASSVAMANATIERARTGGITVGQYNAARKFLNQNAETDSTISPSELGYARFQRDHAAEERDAVVACANRMNVTRVSEYVKHLMSNARHIEQAVVLADALAEITGVS